MSGCMRVLFIAGPTGVGKSALAERIAALMPADIINMDVGQFYAPLTIGTAKPDWQHSSIPHHLFDMVHEPVNISVVEYRLQIETLIKEIHAKNRLPIIVGGSLFYLKSLFFPIAHDVARDGDILFDEDQLWSTLAAYDPKRAATIHPNDTYRLKRALAIAQKTGQKPSAYTMPYKPVVPVYTLLWVSREREDMYQRINDRVQEMINEGWLDEVRALKETAWENFLMSKKLLGITNCCCTLRMKMRNRSIT